VKFEMVTGGCATAVPLSNASDRADVQCMIFDRAEILGRSAHPVLVIPEAVARGAYCPMFTTTTVPSVRSVIYRLAPSSAMLLGVVKLSTST
jgi:hypothetical protein